MLTSRPHGNRRPPAIEPLENRHLLTSIGFLQHDLETPEYAGLFARSRAADMDGDGLLDMVSRGAFDLVWRRNLGDSFDTPIIIDAAWSPDFFVLDLDSDGDNDILASKSSSPIWYENVAAGTFAESQPYDLGDCSLPEKEGRSRYRGATRLMIKVDGGGSNGWRPRLWKRELQRFADESGLTITVCHFPRGASKWNDVEHRLFGPISINWAGQPLRSLDLMLSAIRGTKNDGGLKVTAQLDHRRYATKIKVSDKEMNELNITRHKTCPNWNYTITPRTELGS